jgi:hypothetical protein
MWGLNAIAHALFLSIVPIAQSAPPITQYLCISDAASGLRYDATAGAWHPQAFLPGTRYIVRRVKDEDLKGFPGVSIRDATGLFGETTDTPNGEHDAFIWVFFDFGASPGSYPSGACVETSPSMDHFLGA